MSTHSYSLRNRLSSITTVKSATQSPSTKIPPRSPRKPSTAPSILQLRHVIGTTTTTPSGLACCESTDTFAYCAGTVTVLAQVDHEGCLTYRYFKAHPTATPLNSSYLQHDPSSSNNTPTRRRSVFAPGRAHEEGHSAGFGREWLDDANGQTWSARERIKAATCVSLSPDGKFLAVGETGYNPRVLLFSTSATSPTDGPLSIITDHTIGVRSVAFSPDSRMLATLGDVNDGFLYIWHVSVRTGELKLQSTNKCTTNICDMTWVGNSVVTVGTRHIKVWQVSISPRASPQKRARQRMDGEKFASPGPIPLQGRNCLLGKMVDSTFTGIVAISSEKAVVCTDDGYICMLYLSQGIVTLVPTLTTSKMATAISFCQGRSCVVWANGDGLQEHDMHHILQQQIPEDPMPDLNRRAQRRDTRHSVVRESLGLTRPRGAPVLALKCLAAWTISIDTHSSINVIPHGGAVDDPTAFKLASHRSILRGVQSLPKCSGMGSFFTWAGDGEVRFWNESGRSIRTEVCELEQLSEGDEPGSNELKIVRLNGMANQFITGDRYGVIRIINAQTWSVNHHTRAHSAEVSGISIHEKSMMVATCGRDRMVQLFKIAQTTLELLQTLDDHISAVNDVLFSEDGHKLLSCSADRTAVVRERMNRTTNGDIVEAYLSTKVITLKASPLSMSMVPGCKNIVVLSTMDRHIVKYDVGTGTPLDSFKVSDKDTEDTAVLNSIVLASSRDIEELSTLVGYSSTDKSIRIYDLQKGRLLGRDSGHTEGISDIALIEAGLAEETPSERTIVSTGIDGTIMMWSVSTSRQSAPTPLQELTQAQAFLLSDSDDSPMKASPASLPPLRKILTKVDMAEFVRQNSPSRDASPNRLRRKTSRLALATSIEETDESMISDAHASLSQEERHVQEKRSPSPQTIPRMQPKKQRSKSELAKDFNERCTGTRRGSPSPPSAPVTAPTTPKNQRANNGRLRRPPSIPSDLRGQTSTDQRRRSTTVAVSDFGSMVMASEQTSRMLKTYRKKLQNNKSELDLDDIERELQATLKTIQQKKRKSNNTDVRIDPTSIRQGRDISDLTSMLAKTKM